MADDLFGWDGKQLEFIASLSTRMTQALDNPQNKGFLIKLLGSVTVGIKSWSKFELIYRTMLDITHHNLYSEFTFVSYIDSLVYMSGGSRNEKRGLKSEIKIHC